MTGVTAAGLALLLTAGGVLAAAVGAYLATLGLLARTARAVARPGSDRVTFDVVVPAHDEASCIAGTIASLQALDYPRERFRVLVVADNCTDGTAALARRAGARVLERQDAGRRGKGYALAYAFEVSAADGFAEAVVVVDADSVVSRTMLRVFAGRIVAGAQAVQADYGVRNPDASWRTGLTRLAFALFHGVRSTGRERLGLSCGLRGNGMAFTHGVLARVPHRAFSVVEDVEYGIELGLAGVRVEYAADAQVLGEMPATGAAARTQRARWEDGRRTLIRLHAGRLLAAALRRRDAAPLDLAADLLVPPLAQLCAIVVLGLAASIALLGLGGATGGAVALWGGGLLGLAIYVACGCAASGMGLGAVRHLAWAPVYAAWKGVLRLSPGARGGNAWVRTSRAADGESRSSGVE